MLLTFRFATRQIISQTSEVWARAIRKVRRSCPRPKKFDVIPHLVAAVFFPLQLIFTTEISMCLIFTHMNT